MSYREDRAWSDQFIPQIRHIVGPYLLVESPLEVDQQQAADLIVLRARDMTVAARVRRPGYADKYPNEFTIRSRRDNGAKTELAKIVEGWGDWLFYGHEDEFQRGRLYRWLLIDLHAWRAHFIRSGIAFDRGRVSRIRWGEKANGDGTHFCWFDVTTFPSRPPILIASSHPLGGANKNAAAVVPAAC